jgi:aspartate-semialdehyde dehydrogenase
MEQPKLKCGVLGCTGAVGQRFIALLEGHPWFEVSVLAASAKTASEVKLFKETSGGWKLSTPMPDYVKELSVFDAYDVENIIKEVDFVFSALDTGVATELETRFAEYIPVFSNASSHRMDATVPILIPSTLLLSDIISRDARG